MPTRDQLLAEAEDMFATTKSLDDVVDRAFELLAESVRSLLVVPSLLADANNPKPTVAVTSDIPV